MSAPVPALGAPSLRLRAVSPRSRREGAHAIALPEAIHDRAIVPGDGALRAIPDGNRSAVLDGLEARFAGRAWRIGVKGVGAAAPLYGALPIDDLRAHDFGLGGDVLPPRTIAGESWMGESPYGAQGEAGASHALEITALAGPDGTIEGVPICPVAAVIELPEDAIHREIFWYRRHRGPYLQEIRLVPSDVRLFHSEGRALGRDPEAVLEGLGVEGIDALDAFVDRFLATGLAALTLWARTARPCARGVIEGLDYEDAWLDKDALVAADGAIVLADLESIAWRPTTHREGVEARVRGQIDRNAYELFYGLDALLDVRDRWAERASAAPARRATAIARIALALAPDRWADAIEHEDGLDIEVRVASGAPAVRVRLVDRR